MSKKNEKNVNNWLRPNQLPDGNYFVGRFYIYVKDNSITVASRQHFTHHHEDVDTLTVEQVNHNATILNIVKGKDSKKAEQRIKKLLLEQKPEKVKLT